MQRFGVFAYAPPPPDRGDDGLAPWPGGNEPPPIVVPPPDPPFNINVTIPGSELSAEQRRGLIKLRERLKRHLRKKGKKLDLEEVGAMVWLEALRP